MYAALKSLALELYRRDRFLALLAALCLLGVFVMLIPLALDTRQVMGVNPWVKPIKFTASFGMYFATLGWLLGYLPGPRRQLNIISWVTGLCVLIEAPPLILQAARGVISHFNAASTIDFTIYLVMGAGAFTQAAMLAWTLVLFCTRKVELPRLPLYGIRIGMALWLVGILPAITMTIIGGHNVGVADGGPGLPLLNWSTLGGDLRIAHFLGLHAIQVLPLVGLLLYRMRNRLPARGTQVAFVLIAAGYTLVMVFTFAQAMAGMPLIAWN